MEKNYDLLKETISKNIIKYRKELGLTQLELADKLNYSDKTLSKWERAEAIIGIAHPDFREELIQAAEAQGIWRKSNKR